MRGIRFTAGSAWHRTSHVRNPVRRTVTVTEWYGRAAQDRVLGRRFRRAGVDTTGLSEGQDLLGESTQYVATPWWLLRTMLPPGQATSDDVLLEYGCGKGRVVLWAASRLAVRRAIGVDHDQDLIAAAQVNRERWPDSIPGDIELVCINAADYEVPDDVTLVYLYNPFVGELFAQVLRRIVASLERAPRPLQLVYFYPLMHQSLIEAGFELDVAHRHVFYAWARYWFRPDVHAGRRPAG